MATHTLALDPHTATSDAAHVWTRLEPRARPTQRLLSRVFSDVAPVQLQALEAAVRSRFVSQSQRCARELRASLYAVGARALAHLMEAIWADVAAQDWDVVDIRLAAAQRHFAVVLRSVAVAPGS